MEDAPKFPFSALVYCTERGCVFPIALTLAKILPTFSPLGHLCESFPSLLAQRADPQSCGSDSVNTTPVATLAGHLQPYVEGRSSGAISAGLQGAGLLALWGRD